MPSRLASQFTTDEQLYSTQKTDKQFSKQYANLYWLRLVVLRQRVLERAKKEWGEKGKLEGKSYSALERIGGAGRRDQDEKDGRDGVARDGTARDSLSLSGDGSTRSKFRGARGRLRSREMVETELERGDSRLALTGQETG